MLVEVKPLPVDKWHGKKNKESFAQPKVIEALFDAATGGYATGLTAEEANEYGKKLGVDLSSIFVPDVLHPFWSTRPGSVKLDNSTMFFNLEKPMDYVRVKLMKASKFVANNMREWQEGKWPEATHVIYDEEEDVSIKSTKIQQKRQAILASVKLSGEGKIAMVQLLSKRSVRGRSQEFIDVEIDSIIEEKPDEFLKFFNMGSEEVTIRAKVLEMADKDIINKEHGAYYYMGEIIGADYEATVAWFKDASKDGKLKLSILERLNQKVA